MNGAILDKYYLEVFAYLVISACNNKTKSKHILESRRWANGTVSTGLDLGGYKSRFTARTVWGEKSSCFGSNKCSEYREDEEETENNTKAEIICGKHKGALVLYTIFKHLEKN